MSNKKCHRLGEENLNYQDCLMKIVRYDNANNIVVEFQDEHKAMVKTQYKHYVCGEVKNPYYPSVYGVGITGNKYFNGNVRIKEYQIWSAMMERCFSKVEKIRSPSYEDVTCCEEWLLFDNFYEWLHSQGNFDKWLSGNRWALDKDILVKSNRVYSPDTCCLVPYYVNNLFVKRNAIKNKLYKDKKENMIKQMAESEYANGNITKKCYEAMMNYEVEIYD